MPDARHIAFADNTTGKPGLMSVAADGSSPPEPLTGAERVASVYSFSPDGKYIIARQRAESKYAFVATPLRRDTAGTVELALPKTPVMTAPLVSPDGRWMAYLSDENGAVQFYVRPFPRGEGRVQVSLKGGRHLQWTRDGRRLFYAADGAVRVATLDVSGKIPRLIQIDSLFPITDQSDFTVHPDGKRIAVLRATGTGTKLVIATHWVDDALARLRAQDAPEKKRQR
jgi:serine/threonine-protein kinase